MILERIQQVLEKLVRTFNIKETYIDEYDLWLVISAAAAFLVLSTANRLKYCSPEKIVLGCDMILPIKHKVD